MEPIIEVKGISKKYNILHNRGRYIALRDIITNAIFHPIDFIAHKARQIIGKETREVFWALKDLNFSVGKGEAIGLIGPNGAGKSTLLKILTGITPPSEGEITLRGRVASLLEVGTGFHPELSGRDNIFLNGAILGMTRKEIARKFDEIVAFAGVEKFLDTPVKHYSSGMYVRLAFSVAAHLEPDILLVDEVLAVGDAEFQKKCIGKMDEVTKTAGRTIILVSHNMGAIRRLCKKTALLESGKVKMFGDTDKVVDHYLRYMDNLTKTPLDKRTDRSGNGSLRITDAFILGKDGIKSDQAIVGESIRIAFAYETKKPLSHVMIGANVTNTEQDSLFMCHTDMTNADFGEVSGSGMFVCTIDRLPLTPGTYFANIRVAADGVELDYISNALRFEVLPGDFFKSGSNIYHSKILVDHSWEKLPTPHQ